MYITLSFEMVLALCLGPSLAALQATLALVAPRLVHDQRRCCVSAKAPVAEPVAGGVTRGPVSVFDGVLGPKTLQLICEGKSTARSMDCVNRQFVKLKQEYAT